MFRVYMEKALNRFNLFSDGKFKLFIGLIFSGFLLLLVFLPRYSEVFAVLLLLLGFSVLKGLRDAVVRCRLESYERWLIVVFALYGFISIFSFLYWPATRDSHMRVEDDLKFLICILLYLLLRRYEFNIQWFLGLFVAFVFMMGFTSVSQYVGFSLVADLFPLDHRASAGVNPMRYAVVALVSSCIVINYRLAVKSKSVCVKILLIAVGLMGLVACALTQTRGVWIAIPLLILLYGYYVFKKGNQKYFIAILLGGSLIVGVGLQTDFVQKRVGVTVENIQQYNNGSTHTSLGMRLDVYKASYTLINDRPLWGYGLGTFQERIALMVKNGTINDHVYRQISVLRTPHNEFIQALVERGVIGLLATIMLFFVPGYIFYRAVKSKSEKVTYYGLCGLSVLIVFFVAGQTGTLFNHNLFTNFYIIMVLLFVSQIRVLGFGEGETA